VGGQSIPSFDRDMAPGVKKTYIKNFKNHLINTYEDIMNIDNAKEIINEALIKVTNVTNEYPMLENIAGWDATLAYKLTDNENNLDNIYRIIEIARKRALKDTDRDTYQAMEGFIHNLNTMHSRAGGQVPFSSINYGTDTSPEGRMVMKNLLLTTINGLGNGETPIFPIQIFKMKRGINCEEGEPNYDLYRLALLCTSKRMFPNFSFIDAPYNLQYYDPERPETEIAYMGCRTRVIGNINDKSREQVDSRGNLSFTSINLPRIGIEANGNISEFFNMLDDRLNLVYDQLLERLEVQSKRKVYNFPFMMGNGVWLDSEKLDWNDEVREVLKHGTLSIGFIGLAECLKALIGKHHGESEEAQELGLTIVKHMRDFTDRKTIESGLNITLLATPAENLSGRFVNIDKKRYGIIEGVTDKDYYTNSTHIPVYYDISVFDKIKLEAPYHQYENAGHIAYVEIDGDPSTNLDALDNIVKCMQESGIGYGAINHPLDRDPVCGYNGIIYDCCPNCNRTEEDMPFERIRRITGYLVGTLDRFNNAKRAEESQRVKHARIPFNNK